MSENPDFTCSLEATLQVVMSKLEGLWTLITYQVES